MAHPRSEALKTNCEMVAGKANTSTKLQEGDGLMIVLLAPSTLAGQAG